MSEFEDRLNSILNDEGQMKKITDMAKSLMGGEDNQTAPDMGFDPKMLSKLGAALNNGSGISKKDKQLLEAMLPYMSEKRRNKMSKAMKLASLAGVAELALTEFGGEGDV